MNNTPKFDINQILENSIREEQKEAAKVMYGLYRDFHEAGFSKKQAFDLVKEMIINGIVKKGISNE